MHQATQSKEMPVKILKQNADILSDNICNVFNFCVNEGKLPSILKHANWYNTCLWKRLKKIQAELSFFQYFTCHC